MKINNFRGDLTDVSAENEALLQKRINRAYGRLSRAGIRDHLLGVCKQHGVSYLPGLVTGIDAKQGSKSCSVTTAEGEVIKTRLVTLAGGAVSAKFLQFEADAPTVAVQTAYGIEAEVEGYDVAYDPTSMLFMDYRYHITSNIPTLSDSERR